MKGRSSPGVLPVGHAAFSDSPSAEQPRPRTGRTERPTSAAVASPGHRLHPTDERELVKRARGGDARARAKLVASHERAIKGLAQRFLGRQVEFDDLMQTGRAAFLEALARFDPDREARLWTFAWRRVAGALADAARNSGRALELPEAVAGEVAKAVRHEELLAQRFGRWPTWQEVADDLGLVHDRLAELTPHAQWPVSLSQLLDQAFAETEAETVWSIFDSAERHTEGNGSASDLLSQVELDSMASDPDSSGEYTAGELKALLDAYASVRALQETAADPLTEPQAPRRAGLGTTVRLIDLDRALERVPTTLFVALELHAIKGLSLREQRRYTGVPHTTAQDRFKRGLRWITAFLNGEDHGDAVVHRRAFWLEDLQPSRLAGTRSDLELWARRGQARELFDGKTLVQVHDRDVGEGWLISPRVTDFPTDAARKDRSTQAAT
jgi:RNA polymerase sigma factor (sigma-70 family)